MGECSINLGTYVISKHAQTASKAQRDESLFKVAFELFFFFNKVHPMLVFDKEIKCEFHKGFGPSVQGKGSRKRINHALGAIYIRRHHF